MTGTASLGFLATPPSGRLPGYERTSWLRVATSSDSSSRHAVEVPAAPQPAQLRNGLCVGGVRNAFET
jgi:hypothetical protein